MSGFEIVGVVLGSFPILVNCLDYYRRGLEPLEEWWNFRAHFIAFVDDIRHQMMKYNENMIRLLDPIITDNECLNALVQDPRDQRWRDGSLDGPLEKRLASERDRFLRIIERMDKVMEDLKSLLQIKDGDVSWIGTSEQKPWEWHLKRIQISFSKGKHKKVRKLAAHNQELQEILGYSQRIIPIADRRKTSEPVTLFDRIREHARCAHNALKRHWKCESQECCTHTAHLSLRVETKTTCLNVLFILEAKQGSNFKPLKQEAIIQPASAISASQISHVQRAASPVAVHENLEAREKKKSTLRKLFSKGREKTLLEQSSPGGDTKVPPKHQKQVKFSAPIPVISISQHPQASSSSDVTLGYNTTSPRVISDLCSFLRCGQELRTGIIADEFDRQLELSKSIKGIGMIASDAANLVPLPELLDLYHCASIDLSRQSRFAMAAHIASALLQVHMSPWLSAKWSKRDFYFLADSYTLSSNYPYVSRDFVSNVVNDATAAHPPQSSEEDTRACLFTMGVIILELIFGHNIESCDFRKDYYGADNKPNDQTDISTARKWARKVLGECGADIADSVRRCLDCSFGPKPNFSDKRFREAVYEGVIKPLADYSKVWPEVIP